MRERFILRSLTAVALALVVLAQATPAAAQEMERDPIFGGYQWRQIGPANMSGRIADIEGIPGTGTFYVAPSAAGLWKTVNGGTTFEQVFQGGSTAAVGDIGIAPSDPNRIYVGMGEPHGRNSVSWGDGVYRSDDGGATWRHVGLENTGSIGRIAVHPTNPDIVYVAALGMLWSTETDRGLYKSTDGGANWTLVKGFDDGTGFYDVQIDPTNPDVVYATSWWRLRRPWVFTSGGGDGNQGIWKSTDAGRTWNRLEGGLPPTDGLGKSSIVIFPGDTRILYARVESFTDDPNAPEPTQTQQQAGGRGGGGRGGGTPTLSGTYRSTDAGRTWEMVDYRNGRPFYYCQLRADPKDPNRIFLIDGSLSRIDDVEAQQAVIGDYANRRQNDTVTDITGEHHVDFHALWVDPAFPDHIITGSDGGVGISWDAGDTWDSLKNFPMGQFYAVAYDMQEPYHVYGGLQDNGTWGGPNLVTKPGGIQNEDWKFYNGGDGFHAQVDPVDPDIVLYAESQGGSTNRHNLTTGQSQSIRPRAPVRQTAELSEQQRQFLQGGRGGGRSNVINAPEEGLEQLRFNWSTPFILSPHNPRTLYLGSQYLFKSTDRGDSWMVISPDLTTNDEAKYDARNRGDSQTGAENHCTIITISESPMLPGLIWVGTDDGRVHVTRNGGEEWSEVTRNFRGVPANTWVSRVRASGFAEGRAYVTFDGHRMGDLTTYVFRTDDYGRTWTRITTGLPERDPAYVITEDPVNENLLYLGTESSVYASLDRGAHWTKFSNNLPVVPVHDLVVHPRDHDLIIATHGLAFWVMDDVSGLQSLTEEAMGSDFQLFDTLPSIAWSTSGQTWFPGNKYYAGQNPTFGVRVNYWVGRDTDDVTIQVVDIEGNVVRQETAPGSRGLHSVDLPFRPSFGGGGRGGGGGGGSRGGQFGGGQQAAPGEYRARQIEVGRQLLKVTVGDQEYTQVIEVRPMPDSGGN